MEKETTKKPLGRPTREIKTPKGLKLVLKDYITGREKTEYQNVLYQNAETVNRGDLIKGKKLEKIEMNQKISPNYIIEQESKAIELVVISIEGNTDDTVDRILDLRASEYSYIVNYITKNFFTEEEENEEESL